MAELIERYGTVKSLDEAEMKLEKTEKLLEKAEEKESKQGTNASLMTFPVCYHLVCSLAVNLVSYLLLIIIQRPKSLWPTAFRRWSK